MVRVADRCDRYRLSSRAIVVRCTSTHIGPDIGKAASGDYTARENTDRLEGLCGIACTTTIIIGPLQSTPLLAKAAASLDAVIWPAIAGWPL